MAQKEISKTNNSKKSYNRFIPYISYEGLQIRYGTSDELIIVPLEITQPNGKPSGTAKFCTYWKIGNDIIETPSYEVSWKREENIIKVTYSEEKNDKMNMFAAKYDKDFKITYGEETYIIKDGIIDRILWQAEDSKDVTFDSKKNTKSLSFKQHYFIEREKRSTEQYIRDQSAFRNNLLNIEPKCAITGITAKNALQAAHIVAVKDGGFEYINNGLLLRADLHLLFDNELLTIDNDGVVHIDKNEINDEEYLNLNGKKISDSNLQRIRENLEKANKIRNQKSKKK